MSITQQIRELNEKGICTRGFGTFGCACPECLEKMRVFGEKLIKELQEDLTQ